MLLEISPEAPREGCGVFRWGQLGAALLVVDGFRRAYPGLDFDWDGRLVWWGGGDSLLALRGAHGLDDMRRRGIDKRVWYDPGVIAM